MTTGSPRRAKRRDSDLPAALFMSLDIPDSISGSCWLCGMRSSEVFFAGTAWGCLWLCRHCGGNPPVPKEMSA